MNKFWGSDKTEEITPSRFSCSICNKTIDVSFPVYPRMYRSINNNGEQGGDTQKTHQCVSIT